MTVYVDDGPSACGPMRMAHLMADTEAELHEMAQRIGVARRWYQRDHYDVSLSERRQAIAAGAVPTTSRDLVWRFRRKPEGVGA